ncbi:MAG: AraC-like DNA-binding protein [Bacteroidia bacterium]|jgi:AraC-like DNA-binding protein
MLLMESEHIGKRRLSALKDVLSSRYPEVDQRALTVALGLQPDWSNPERQDSLQLFLNAVMLLRQKAIPDIALQIGDRAQLTDTGLLGYAALTAPTVLQAAKITGHAMNASGYVLRSKMATTDTHYLLVYTSTSEVRPYREPLLEMSMIAIWRCIQAILPEGQTSHPSYVTFNYPAPAYGKRYEDLFGCPVFFNEAHTVIALPKQWIFLPILTGNSAVLASCAAEVKQVLGEGYHGTGIVAQVKRALVEQPQSCQFSSEGTAALLKLNARSLRRYLAQASTNFRSVCLEVRMGLARQYLRNSNMPLKEIAYQLGYTHTNNFNRAYRNYYSASPEAMRHQSVGEPVQSGSDFRIAVKPGEAPVLE